MQHDSHHNPPECPVEKNNETTRPQPLVQAASFPILARLRHTFTQVDGSAPIMRSGTETLDEKEPVEVLVARALLVMA